MPYFAVRLFSFFKNDDYNLINKDSIYTRVFHFFSRFELFISNDTGSARTIFKIHILIIIFFIFQAEVDDTLKRIQEHKGVQGYLIINNDGKLNT